MTTIAEHAAAWWAKRLVDETKRDAFRAALLPLFEEKMLQSGEGADLGYVDYDPDEVLLQAIRSAGIPCRGFCFSASGVINAHKTGLQVRDGFLMMKNGYGSPWERLVDPSGSN